MPEKPQAVIFDFGGVLCFHPAEDRFAPIAKLFRIGTADLIRLFWANRIDYDAGRLDAETYWRGVAKGAGAAWDQEQLPTLVRREVELWNDYDERVLGWAAHLQAHGIRTAILSNLPRVLGEELRITPGFLDPFDHVTFSYELGMIKPEPAIYKDAIRGLGIEPQHALFLDDRPENVQGAITAGMRAELYSTWESFLENTLGRYSLPVPAPDAAQ